MDYKGVARGNLGKGLMKMLYILIVALVYNYMNLLKLMEEFIKKNEFYSKKFENGE